MLFGMAGYRSGFLTGEWARRRYRQVAAATLGIGGLVTLGLGLWVVESNFHVRDDLLRLPRARRADRAGHGVRLCRADHPAALRPGGALTGRVAAVGRTAFSNYLGTSLIAAAHLLRRRARPVRAACRGPRRGCSCRSMWLLMLAWSKPWLDRFALRPVRMGLAQPGRVERRADAQAPVAERLDAARAGSRRYALGSDPPEALVGDLAPERARGAARASATGWSPCRTARSSVATACAARRRRRSVRWGSCGSRC